MKVQITTTDLSSTYKLGQIIGQQLRGDETFALMGELGSGKTSFTQGLAKGLNIKDNVISPTFVLERIYQVPKQKFDVHHFDLYRIGKDIQETGLIDMLGGAVVVIEWPEKIKNYLPEDTIWVTIKHISENSRQFTFQFADDKQYVFKNID